MLNTNVHFKVAALYCVFSVIMVFSVWLVYDNTRTLTEVNRRNDYFTQRRDMADSLVFSLLEAGNAERSICLGMTGEWSTFDRALRRASSVAAALKQAATEPQQLARADSLIMLIDRKRSDMVQIMDALGPQGHDQYYQEKMRDLQSGRDSVVIHPDVNATTVDRETVYEVVKTRKTFLARLADAFRGQRTDTVKTTRRHGRSTADSLGRGINLADTVADVLAEIKRAENRSLQARQQALQDNNRRLQLLSLETAVRTEQLLKDITTQQRSALQKALDDNRHERRMLIIKVTGLAAVAVFSAMVLMFFVYRDIRSAALYSRNLELAKAETERIMQQRERLLLTITHDIKAPAASISGFIELLRDYVSDPRGRSFLNNIGSSANHLLTLVSALLDYHQLEKGKVEPRRESFSPERLVESCAAERQPQAAAKGLKLESRYEGHAGAVCRGDAFRIKQILDNLLSNAVKYTAEGGITLTAILNGRQLVLKVSDTGSGMTEEETRRVFNAFTRLPGAQGTEGVGLGLSIVREVVQMLGGRISISSTVGRGSTFTVVLPVERVEGSSEVGKSFPEIKKASSEEVEPSAATPQPSRKSPISPVAPASGDDTTNRTYKSNTTSAEITHHSSLITHDSSPVSILILDDDRLQLQLLTEMFSRTAGARWQITACRSAREALETAAQTRPDLMLIDQEMPEMNGLEVLRRLSSPTTRTIAMTAHEPSIAPKLKAAGFTACLFKPFTVARLAEVLSKTTGIEITEKRSGSAGPQPQSQLSDDTRPTPPDNPFAALTAFADGDSAAERQILTDFRNTLAEARQAFNTAMQQPADGGTSAPDRTLITRTAHKLLPTLSMTGSAATSSLRLLTPDGIKLISDSGLGTLISGITREIDVLIDKLNHLIHNS